MLTRSKETWRKKSQSQTALFLGRFVSPFNRGRSIRGGSLDLSLMYIIHETISSCYNIAQGKRNTIQKYDILIEKSI